MSEKTVPEMIKHAISQVGKMYISERYKIELLALLTQIQYKAQKDIPQWHETFEDDPDSFPDSDRPVIVSFSNLDTQRIGEWRVDEDGGAWYIPGSYIKYLEYDDFVDGWWELPSRPEVEDDYT